MPNQSAQVTLTDGQQLNYQVRESARARYLRMQISARHGLVVTRPQGVTQVELERWVASKTDWINKQLGQLAASPEASRATLPNTITLLALQQHFSVHYQAQPSQQKLTLECTPETQQLRLQGPIEQHTLCYQALRQWLQAYAKVHLGQWLRQTAQETGLSFSHYRVKGQKSRWGSCSSRGNINLNYKLLFLPAEWVHYTLVHELCHTLEMNHSERFWAQVEQFAPDYRRINQAMRHAASYIPAWADPH